MFCIFHVPTQTYLYGASTRLQIDNEMVACVRNEPEDPTEYEIFEIPGEPPEGQIPELTATGSLRYIEDPKETRRRAAKESFNTRMKGLGFTEAELSA